MDQYINNKSPLRYPGGKTRACKKLDMILLREFKIDEIYTLISPFLGGASFEFYLQNKYGWNIICNDKFEPLYNFWNICKVNNGELCEKLYNVNNVDKNQFIQYRNNIMSVEDELMRAAYYFIINRCSFNGSALSGGFSKESSKKRFTKSSIDRIKSLDLSKFWIYNEDFKKFMNKNNPETSIIFLDPPYYLENTSKLYGINGDMSEKFDHYGLYVLLRSRKKWIMTYNDCKYIRELYKDYKFLDIAWNYGMNKTKQSSEIVIIRND